ncbi:MAG: NnrU protein [Rhodospirillales bacterium]|nr:NnrU protein [Rhodospirillales bacterium]
MTGGLGALILATAVFVGAHLVLSSLPVRDRLVAILRETGFRAAYSLQALALLAWVIFAFNAAPYVEVWAPAVGLRHLSLTLMPIACVLVVAGLASRNPTAVGADTAAVAAAGPVGIFRVTRHPVMWGVALWALAHLLANGDAAGMILFAGMGVLALGGAAQSDARRRASVGEAWAAYRARSSFVPFVALLARRTPWRPREIGWARLLGGLALYALLLLAHPWLFGVLPLPGLG